MHESIYYRLPDSVAESLQRLEDAIEAAKEPVETADLDEAFSLSNDESFPADLRETMGKLRDSHEWQRWWELFSEMEDAVSALPNACEDNSWVTGAIDQFYIEAQRITDETGTELEWLRANVNRQANALTTELCLLETRLEYVLDRESPRDEPKASQDNWLEFVLVRIAEDPSLSNKQLAEEAGVSPATLSRGKNRDAIRKARSIEIGRRRAAELDRLRREIGD